MWAVIDAANNIGYLVINPGETCRFACQAWRAQLLFCSMVSLIMAFQHLSVLVLHLDQPILKQSTLLMSLELTCMLCAFCRVLHLVHVVAKCTKKYIAGGLFEDTIANANLMLPSVQHIHHPLRTSTIVPKT